MSGPSRSLNYDEAENTLSILTVYLDRFLDAWDSAEEPPILAEFLPDEKKIRRMTLVELIKVDLEYRWQHRNCPKRLSEYLDEFPELGDGGIPADLVYEEFHIRKNSGFAVDPHEYLEQFPEQADELACLLELGNPYESTLISGVGAKRKLKSIEVGQDLDDFQLLANLGEGAFAKVFLARQKSMQRLVALKVSADSGTEPQTLAQFDHDYIVRVFDQRIDHERELRLLYMQYVAGGTLQDTVDELRESDPEEWNGQLLLRSVERTLEARGESRPVESRAVQTLKSLNWPETVCWIGSRLARALDHAHRRGILHRDVKPANVLLTAEGIPKLADFNISFSSKLSGDNPAAYFGGSLSYMSPEQLEACNPADQRAPDSLDGRSDLFSLGVLLWELLTGARPFVDEQMQGNWLKALEAMTARRKRGIDGEALDRLPRDCPPGLIRILRTCLAPNVDDRWDSGEEMAKQLDLCLNRRVQELLHPPEGSWALRVSRKIALFLVFLAAAIPNGLAAYFNFVYNDEQVKKYLPDARDHFYQLVTVINAIAFPIGLGLLIWLTLYVVRGVRDMREGRSLDRERLKRLRYRSIHLGHYAAIIGVTLWAVAGIAYPISIRLAAGEMPPIGYVHFVVSFLLSGIIAAAYPFFGATYFSLRVLYPALLLDDVSASDDTAALRRLMRLTWGYLVMAVLVPLLGLMTQAFIDDPSRLALAVLSVGGVIGAGLSVWMFRRLQADLTVLIDALSARS